MILLEHRLYTDRVPFFIDKIWQMYNKVILTIARKLGEGKKIED